MLGWGLVLSWPPGRKAWRCDRGAAVGCACRCSVLRVFLRNGSRAFVSFVSDGGNVEEPDRSKLHELAKARFPQQ